jgi:hypothetical protein
MLPRLQLFEFNDAPWAPAAPKELIVEALSRTLRWGRVLRGVVEPLRQLLDETGCDEVLDLASGAGGPAQVLVEELQASGRASPRFLLTDLQPHVEEWDQLKQLYPESIDYVAEPVDATKMDPQLAKGRVQLVINALHHFPPELARDVLLSACQHAPGIFIAEGLIRHPRSLMAISVPGIPALYASALVSKRHRVAKAALTWLCPAMLAASFWDGAVSTLRMYSEEELRELVREAPAEWRWDYGRFSFPFGGRGSWFRGVKTGGA